MTICKKDFARATLYRADEVKDQTVLNQLYNK